MKKAQLFLLHFAGGNCYSFQFLTPLLGSFEVIPLELPGRGRRIQENLLTDFDLAARDIYRQIKARLSGGPFLIYGHSMGAYLGLRVTNLLQRTGRSPACLIVSGNAGPGVKSDRLGPRYLLGHEEFIKELKLLGGIPEQVLEEKELFDFFEPILRADFQVAETHEMENEPAVHVPLCAMMGSEEEKVDRISNWGRFTTAGFTYEVLPGDHFFIHKHPAQIAALLKACYEEAVGNSKF